MKAENDNLDHRKYMSLLSLNYQSIYSFILLLIANHNNADDIMQETTVFMYENFQSYKEGTDFLAWAKTIAKYKTLEFLKKKKREKVVFDQTIVEYIDIESRDCQKNHDEWLGALRECVSLLPETDRQLLNIRYYENLSVPKIADRMGCSFQKLYRNIARINHLLVKCIHRKVEACS